MAPPSHWRTVQPLGRGGGALKDRPVITIMDKESLADSEFFYERETEFFGFTPFQLLDGVGEIVVKAVFSMFDRLGAVTVPAKASSFLSPGQIEAVGDATPLIGASRWR